jgi:hypothetical protein
MKHTGPVYLSDLIPELAQDPNAKAVARGSDEFDPVPVEVVVLDRRGMSVASGPAIAWQLVPRVVATETAADGSVVSRCIGPGKLVLWVRPTEVLFPMPADDPPPAPDERPDPPANPVTGAPAFDGTYPIDTPRAFPTRDQLAAVKNEPGRPDAG